MASREMKAILAASRSVNYTPSYINTPYPADLKDCLHPSHKSGQVGRKRKLMQEILYTGGEQPLVAKGHINSFRKI